MKNSKDSAFNNAIQQLHISIKQRFTALIKIVTSGNDQKVRDSATLLQDDVKSLKRILASKDQPKWLNDLDNFLQRYISKSLRLEDLNISIANVKSSVDRHTWSFSAEAETFGFNFDDIFTHYRDKSELPELFDRTISLLEKILASGEIESIYVREALEKLISSMEISKKGSLYSMEVAWQFFVDFATRFLINEIETYPVIGSAIKALKETIDEGNVKFLVSKEEAFKEVQNNVSEGLGVYKRKNEKPAIGYQNTGQIVLSNSESHISAEA